jgi:hypothetical protein
MRRQAGRLIGATLAAALLSATAARMFEIYVVDEANSLMRVKSPISRSKLAYDPKITHPNPPCWHFCWHKSDDIVSRNSPQRTALARAGGWLRSARSTFTPHAP